MSNVTESGAVWEPGVYQIKTTDPVLGGPNGIANVQAGQLANRTAYLKIRADDVDAARGASPTLAARIAALAQSVTSLSPETQNAVIAALKFAIDQANVANKGVQALHQFAQQEGLITIRNRGIVSGCTVTRSTTATRNLSLDAGACFAGGQVMDVDATANAGSVPSNPGSGAATVFAFLHQGAEGRWRLAVTALGQPVPGHGIVIYQLTVPGGSTDATVDLARAAGAEVVRAEAGRGRQLAAGAAAARGPWLLFLHADTRLDNEAWAALRDYIAGAEGSARAAVFGFRLDDAAWQARLLEVGVAVRVGVLALP